MAANPILMFASLCCGIMGISFFFGFYFGMVEKDIEHNKEIDDLIARVCVIFYSAQYTFSHKLLTLEPQEKRNMYAHEYSQNCGGDVRHSESNYDFQRLCSKTFVRNVL